MITYDSFTRASYANLPETVAAVESLNSAGLETIIENHEDFGDPIPLGIPLKIVKPLERQQEPLQEFEDGFVMRVYGAANGHRVSEQLVLNSLVAEVTKKPVIGVALPNRDWDGQALKDYTNGWGTISDEQKDYFGMVQLDYYAKEAIDKTQKALDTAGASLKISASGESQGASVALSIGHVAAAFDVDVVSVSALVNVERRKLYRGLFADFAKTGSLQTMATSEPCLEPFVKAAGFDVETSKLSQQLGALRYAARDLFGVMPFDPRFVLYTRNRSLVRPLTVPIGLRQIERLAAANGNSVDVHVAMFQNDPVAKPEELVSLGRSRCSTTARYYQFMDTAHEACNNPAIIGFMAGKLVGGV